MKEPKWRHDIPTWHKSFRLLDESYSVPDIQDYFEIILKSMEKKLIIFQ